VTEHDDYYNLLYFIIKISKYIDGR